MHATHPLVVSAAVDHFRSHEEGRAHEGLRLLAGYGSQLRGYPKVRELHAAVGQLEKHISRFNQMVLDSGG